MAARRNRRASVEDLWYKTVSKIGDDGTKTSERVPSKLHGTGKRWRARYVDDNGKEHSQRFTRKADAKTWLDGPGHPGQRDARRPTGCSDHRA
ncbi:hypothetical protein [Nocardia sp. CC227C]|uniref:hypothetical protein n=1 Tax=Nocardia sp. CC227C TaxID=3044562 RepID=UPI00278C353F|nr:hypothetical protein [Nocardia sp. CC227C]